MLSGLKALPLRLHLFVELQFGAGLRKLYAKFHCVLINISKDVYKRQPIDGDELMEHEHNIIGMDFI